jgi:polar amino acid transport system substrate-binding protein
MIHHRQSVNIVVLMLLSLFLAGLLAGCRDEGATKSRQSALARVAQSKVLRVGYIVFPPAVTKDPNTGVLSGHFVETVTEIARQADWKIEFVETDWSGFTAGLNSGRFDLSIAPTFVTIPRALSVSFSRPLFFAGNSAVVRKGETRFSDIASLDREGITISVTQGEAGHEYAKANFKKAKLNVLPGPDQSLTFQDVVSGRSDAALGDAYVTAKFASAHPSEIRDLFADNPYNLTPVSWAVKTGEYELLAFVNDAMEALESQNKLIEFEKASDAHWLHLKRSYELAHSSK